MHRYLCVVAVLSAAFCLAGCRRDTAIDEVSTSVGEGVVETKILNCTDGHVGGNR